MPPVLGAALSETTPFGFVTVEALLLVAGGLAAIGAVLTVFAIVRSRRTRRQEHGPEGRRRAPTPASLGLDDDPIVAAIVGADEPGRQAGTGRVDPVDPLT